MIPRLLVVTDRHGADRPLVETVRAVLEGGARWVWFRDRDMEPAERHDMAAALLARVREAGGRLTIGGDAGLAAAIGADGVHLNGSAQGDGHHLHEPHPASAALSIPERVAAARRLIGAGRLVGLSAHGLSECRAAVQAGADYVTLSPIFATASKPGYGPALGLETLHAAAAIGIPVVALGGIGLREAPACRAAGAAGAAVMGGLMRALDPAASTRAFLDALG